MISQTVGAPSDSQTESGPWCVDLGRVSVGAFAQKVESNSEAFDPSRFDLNLTLVWTGQIRNLPTFEQILSQRKYANSSMAGCRASIVR
jgi:hypothetical protein